MPVAKLYLEGNLDTEVLTPILQGTPAVQPGGSKNSLRPRANAERRDNNVAAGYLRDRDFDFDPPEDLSRPTVDSEQDGTPYGWRWCRHELENYLLEPSLISAATRRPTAEIEAVLCAAALRLRGYEAARWTVGVVRRALPPHHELGTRPTDLKEIGLPVSLNAAACADWAASSIARHRVVLADAMDDGTVAASLERFTGLFNDDFVSDVQQVLIWFPGKDLLAGMAGWADGLGLANPGAFRAVMRDWIILHPANALELLPEWRGLVQAIRA